MNTAMLSDQVYNKMRGLAFHTVVNKAFINALPIAKSEMTPDNVRAISSYSLKALESAGGIRLLESALGNTKDVFKRGLLKDIYDICEESARQVASRVAMEANKEEMEDDEDDEDPKKKNKDDDDTEEESEPIDDLSDDAVDDEDAGIDDVKSPDDTENVPTKPEVIRQGKPFKELVADAKMTDEEYSQFVMRLGKLDLPEISKLINERVEQAMRAEKETYRMIDETDQRLKNAITDKADEEGDTLTDDQVEEIKESVLEIPLKGKVREHVSLFSTLQAAAIESVHIHDTVDKSVADTNLLLSITENCTFDGIFTAHEQTLEQLLKAAYNYGRAETACECVGEDDRSMVYGTTLATIVYTLLQTLHSMNLIHLTPSMVKKCCDANDPAMKCPDTIGKQANDKVKAALEKNNRTINNIKYLEDAEEMVNYLAGLRETVYTARDSGFPLESSVESAFEHTIQRAINKKNELSKAIESVVTVDRDTPTSRRLREIDKCHMDSISRAFRNTPVDTIEFRCTEGSSFVDIRGMNKGSNVKSTSIVLESTFKDVTEDKYLKALIASSNLPSLRYGVNKPELIIHTNTGKYIKV